MCCVDCVACAKQKFSNANEWKFVQTGSFMPSQREVVYRIASKLIFAPDFFRL